jgi:hypothetical protein
MDIHLLCASLASSAGMESLQYYVNYSLRGEDITSTDGSGPGG